MPLYEIVLRYPHGEEVRLADRAPAVGDTLQIDYVGWKVVAERDPTAANAAARYVCEPACGEVARSRSAGDSHRRTPGAGSLAAAEGA
jgi:hypothetical protein